MVKNISIQNFKSVKQIELYCNKVNVFIGEPNTGKSNILEALSFFSPGILGNISGSLRFRSIADLFYDSDFADGLYVKTDDLSLSLEYDKTLSGPSNPVFNFRYERQEKVIYEVQMDHSGKMMMGQGQLFDSPFRQYSFKKINEWKDTVSTFLSTPSGDNLPFILRTHPKLRKLVADLFKSKDLRLMIRPHERDISVSKEVDETLYSYPFSTISETLQRIIFLLVAIQSNENAILVLDEPEAHTFPLFTKALGEAIALDKTNQFFISTHSPYLLMNIIEKTQAADLSVFICKMENFRTTVSKIPEENLSKMLDLGPDVFFNLDQLID